MNWDELIDLVLRRLELKDVNHLDTVRATNLAELIADQTFAFLYCVTLSKWTFCNALNFGLKKLTPSRLVAYGLLAFREHSQFQDFCVPRGINTEVLPNFESSGDQEQVEYTYRKIQEMSLPTIHFIWKLTERGYL